MQTEQLLRFGPYRFDPQTIQLWRGTLEVSLTPKALAVLRILVTRPAQVVTKDEFFAVVWPDTVVSEEGKRKREALFTRGDLMRIFSACF